MRQWMRHHEGAFREESRGWPSPWRWLSSLAVLIVATSVAAGVRPTAEPGEPAPKAPKVLEAMLAGGIAIEDLEYLRSYSNGIVEYAVTPPTWMSRPPSFVPAFVTARHFIDDNAWELGLCSTANSCLDATDFRFVWTDQECDGSATVTLRQTRNGVPVETADMKLRVAGGRVTHIEARFVHDLGLLPFCQGRDGEIRYLPYPNQTIIVVVVDEQVTTATKRSIYDACTNQLLGTVESYDVGR